MDLNVFGWKLGRGGGPVDGSDCASTGIWDSRWTPWRSKVLYEEHHQCSCEKKRKH